MFLFMMSNCFGVLIVHFPLDDNKDSSTVKNVVYKDDGTYYSNADTSTEGDTEDFSRPGRHGRGMYFDGAQPVIRINGIAEEINALTTQSISVWFNSTSLNERVIFSAEDNSDQQSYFTLYYDAADDGISIDIFQAAARILSAYIDNDSAQQDGEWHNVVYTSDSSGNKMYMDSVLQTLFYDNGSSSTNGSFLSVTAIDTVNIGARWDWVGGVDSSEFEWLGRIQDLRIYNHVLTQEEVNDLYNIDKKVLVSYLWMSDIHWRDGLANSAGPDRYYAEVRTAGLKMDKVIPWAIDQGIDFVVLNGDNIDEEDSAVDDDTNLDNLIDYIDDSTGNVPVYFVIGNHDTEATDFTKALYVAVVDGHANWSMSNSYHSWDAGGIHFIALESAFNIDGTEYTVVGDEVGPYYIPAEERNWLATELSIYRYTPCVVFCHVPLDVSVDEIAGAWGTSNDNTEKDYITVLDILETYGNVIMLHSGHYHGTVVGDGIPPNNRSALYLSNSFRHYNIQGLVNSSDAADPGTKAACAIVHIYNDNTVRIEPYANGDASGTWGQNSTFGFTPPVGVDIKSIRGSTQAAENLKSSMDKH